MSGSNDVPQSRRGLLGRIQERNSRDLRVTAQNNLGVVPIDIDNPTAGMFGAIPANPQSDPQYRGTEISLQTVLNTPEISQALDRLARREAEASNRQPTLNETRTSITNLVGEAYRPEPNILDQFANYTYHVRLSMTNDIDAYSINTSPLNFGTIGKQFENLGKVVIAESGVTVGFNISDFEIENLCSPGPRVQAMQHTNWKMTIREPYGLSLVDRIYSISKTMGVSNHLTAPYFIEIWFTGYDENGNIKTLEMKESIYRLFRVNMTKIMSDTSASGTVYSIEGLFDGSFANSDHVAIAPNAINVTSVRTVGDFFNKLSNELNRIQSRLQYDSTTRIEYQFNIPEYIRNWAITQTSATSRRNSDISVASGRGGLPNISIARGMDISAIVYFVIGLSEQARDFMAGESTRPRQNGASVETRPGGASSRASLQANGMANMINIHSQTQLIGFDYLTNDYIRRVTYTLTEYPTTRAVVDAATLRNSQTPAAQRDRAETQLSSNRYVKAYEYIYTGRNLDILKMDIRLELTWAAAIPLQQGENTYTNFTVGPQLGQGTAASDILSKFQQEESRRVRAKADIQRLTDLSRQQRLNVEQRTELDLAKRELQAADAAIRGLGVNRTGFQVLWDNQSPGQQSLSNQQALQSLRTGDQRLLQNQAVADDLAARYRWSQQSRQRRQTYLEDVQVTPVLPTSRIPVAMRPNPGPTNQNVTQAGEASPDSRSRNPGEPPRGRGLVGTILNDVTTSPYLVEMDLEIRGDPYWLGLGNVAEASILSSGNASAPRQNQAAWFMHGEVGFLLTFRTGEAPNENTGYMDFSESSIAFAGMYGALRIRNSFRDGKFTQAIKAYRDNLLDLPSLRNQQTNINTGQPAAAGSQVAPLQQSPANVLPPGN
jgi:hypothetical protein